MPVQQVLTDQRVPVKIWTDDVDDRSKEQLANIAGLPFVHHHVAAMPDVHLGIGATIGSVIATHKAIIPAAVGVDIGCGMYTIALDKQPIDFARLDEAAHIVPSGMNVWPEKQADFNLQRLYCYDKLKKLSWIACSIGTLGGGNHFIEVD